jgi:hypothetical protein
MRGQGAVMCACGAAAPGPHPLCGRAQVGAVITLSKASLKPKRDSKARPRPCLDPLGLARPPGRLSPRGAVHLIQENCGVARLWQALKLALAGAWPARVS